MSAAETIPEQPSAASDTAALPVVHIGTRKSVLARVQTDIVAKELRKAWPDRKYEINAMSTMGDKDQKTALHEFNAKSLWTTELEELLESGELDLVVHSLKGPLCCITTESDYARQTKGTDTDEQQTCRLNCLQT